MKNRRQAALAAVLVLAVACASANQAAYVTVGSTVKLVDLAMKTWAAYVVAGHATADQEAAVRTAHDHYRQTAATAAVILNATNETPTPQQFADAAAAVVSLIEAFTGKKIAVAP